MERILEAATGLPSNVTRVALCRGHFSYVVTTPCHCLRRCLDWGLVNGTLDGLGFILPLVALVCLGS